MGLGFRIAVELVAGIAVGTLIGYALDGWLGTRPWLMVVFLFLGCRRRHDERLSRRQGLGRFGRPRRGAKARRNGIETNDS